jgi:hypothetical protein
MDIDKFEKANATANLVMFSISTLLTLLLLLRFKFRADKAAYVIILSYLITIGTRILL